MGARSIMPKKVVERNADLARAHLGMQAALLGAIISQYEVVDPAFPSARRSWRHGSARPSPRPAAGQAPLPYRRFLPVGHQVGGERRPRPLFQRRTGGMGRGP